MRSKCLLVTIICILICSPLFSHGVQKRYPHTGRFKYNGVDRVDAYFIFHNPGGWTTSQPGLEIDLNLHADFYTSCTSWNNMPNSYDDCPTAGTLEDDPSRRVFSLGTYSAASIQPNQEYNGFWLFTTYNQGTLQDTNYSVGWQEVYRRSFCIFTDPRWCMIGAGGSVLIDRSNQLRKGVEHRHRWWWTDNSASSGAWKQEPEGTYYYSVAGRHVGYLKGPDTADFDLYLFKWNGSSWIQVKGSARYPSQTGGKNIEEVTYDGAEGYYTWNIHAYSGSGSYQIGVDYPSRPGTSDP